MQEPLTLYKLIVLYMLDRVSFPMSYSQISEFILEKEYTNFLTLQQTITELTEAGLVTSQTARNRTLLSATEDGLETLNFFQNRISEAIKEDVKSYLKEHEYSLRNEVSVMSDYYKSTSGEYNAHLVAKDREITVIELTLSLPTEELAASVCDKWQSKNQEIYQDIISKLF